MITGKYLEFYNKISDKIPTERMFHDALSTLAFGTDASFYRLIPKLVIRASSTDEVRYILNIAHKMDIPVTFRAAGTSLSGQAISDSVLVIVSKGFTHHKVYARGEKILLEPGIRGAMANRLLVRFGRKIGPDPASIDAAMIGGIAANNASGMCCGTSQNSYKTIADIDIVLSDGSELNTASPTSCRSFRKTHKQLISGLEAISKKIAEDKVLHDRIERKYKIKNTTGYSLNAFVDYDEGIDIIKHLIIGSEGTLAFISNITYNTVVEHRFKSLALIIYPTIKDACSAVQIIKQQPVSAAEILDRAAIKSVDQAPGIPEFLKTLPDGACALLVETRGEDEVSLEANVKSISESIKDIKTLFPIEFTTDESRQATLWKVRKETLPTVAGMRRPGTTAIIEDICFPIPKLAEAVTELRELFDKDGYSQAVIFGHALAGNLHFMFNQAFNTQEEVDKYAKFMDDITTMVVSKYDGSLKAEHGTGRNMAPFVEKEWGEQAYALMKQVKNLFDPKGILNPGVILNSDAHAHIKNLKPCPAVSETIDKCMECGFCERTCVADGYTLSPRQRVSGYREMKRLEKTGTQSAVLAEMQKRYAFWGPGSCATDSLCAIACPVNVDTGKLTKELRHESHSEKAEEKAVNIARHMSHIVWLTRAGWNFVYWMRILFGKKVFGALAWFARAVTGGLIPAWNQYYPAGGGKIAKSKLPEYQEPISTNTLQTSKAKNGKVVYFPSCITRTMGNSKDYRDALTLTQITEKLIKKAGYEVVYPANLKHLCCGMAFSSKGYVKAGTFLSDNLKRELAIASENGKYPILCDMSPCTYTMKENFGKELRVYEPVEFSRKFLIPKLRVRKLNKSVAVFAVCTAKKMGVDNMLYDIAKACARRVIVVDENCCGFAGDKGFMLPELNENGLRNLRAQVADCKEGYATSRTCEIGLSNYGKITFKSILYLIDEASN
ncbi:MAG: FAD-binding and (Fe-S)-binding domain-containing protein [Bacteroidales bacterium]|nr:FAD-binding and (Fe-S)-binding domain-containing protein [Bacteroidales bacterium]